MYLFVCFFWGGGRERGKGGVWNFVGQTHVHDSYALLKIKAITIAFLLCENIAEPIYDLVDPGTFAYIFINDAREKKKHVWICGVIDLKN